jgi:hypothetical protein
MEIELLFFDGCPNYATVLPRLRELIASSSVSADIRLTRVEGAEAADRERFLGSPTIRVDGEDVEPGADRRTDFGLKCRLFATPDGLQGTPPDEWVLSALRRAGAPCSELPTSPGRDRDEKLPT